MGHHQQAGAWVISAVSFDLAFIFTVLTVPVSPCVMFPVGCTQETLCEIGAVVTALQAIEILILEGSQSMTGGQTAFLDYKPTLGLISYSTGDI